jgi:hypothetical protein
MGQYSSSTGSGREKRVGLMGDAFAFLAGFLLGMLATVAVLLVAEVEVTIYPKKVAIKYRRKRR